MRILVVDDDHISLLAISKPLRQEGFDVTEAMRIEHVLKAAIDGSYDIVILDIFMPGMGGIEGIRKIREANPNSKIVAVTGGYADMPAMDTITAAVKVGADVGYVKPVDIDQMVEKIQSWS